MDIHGAVRKLVLAILLALLAWIIFQISPKVTWKPDEATATTTSQSQIIVADFNSCVNAGYPIMESYPRQCRAGEFTFVEDIGGPEPFGSACAVAGCSGQLCVSAEEAADVVTTCEYREAYSCYRSARCELQANGACGWTGTPELNACLRGTGGIDAAQSNEAEEVF